MRKVPEFALYGSDVPQPAWADGVHVERIPDRSRLFDWEIQPHVHEALIQVLCTRTAAAARRSSTTCAGCWSRRA